MPRRFIKAPLMDFAAPAGGPAQSQQRAGGEKGKPARRKPRAGKTERVGAGKDQEPPVREQTRPRMPGAMSGTGGGRYSRPARIMADTQLSTKQAQPTQTVTIPTIARQRMRLSAILSESIIIFLIMAVNPGAV
ncbi:MAG: hypothetical protein DBX44_08365 [Oscillospiraceae bacterium]|nr:MAG: hypothetical protein DBX44_08365 [Oscillospiraceae bacterium]